MKTKFGQTQSAHALLLNACERVMARMGRKQVPSTGALLAAVVAAAMAPPAQAATYYWDTNGTTAGFGTAGGTWGTSTDWTTDATGVAAPGTTTSLAADDVNFGTAATGLFAGTVSITGTQNANTLTFGSASSPIILSGAGTINLTAGTIAVNNGMGTIGNNTATVLAGSAGLTKTGPGTLALNGSAVNTFTGGLNVNAGTLALNYANLATPTDLVNSGNALTLGGGTLTLTAKNNTASSQTFNGLTLNQGTSTLMAASTGTGAMNVVLGAITRNPGGAINFAPSGAGTLSTTAANDSTGILGTWASVGAQYAAVSAGKIVAYTGMAATDASGLTDTTGTVNYDLAAGGGTAPGTVSANTIRYTGGVGTTAPGATSFTVNGLMNAGTGLWTIGSNALTIGSNKELVVNTASNAIAISSVIKDNGGGASALMKTGSNTLTLSGANTYTGGTTLNAGTLMLGNAAALGTGTLTINGGTLDSSVANLINTNNNAQIWNSDFTFAGTNSLNLGTGAVSLGTTAGTSRTVIVSANTLTIGGVISNGTTANSLVKAGAGTLTLNGASASTFTGGVTVNAGTLKLDFANMGTPTDLVNSGNALTLGGGTLSISSKSGATTSQTFNGLTLNRGASAIGLTSNGGAATSLVLANGITRNAGGTVDFTLPASTSISDSATGTASTILTAANGAAYATVGGTDWAAKDATNTHIVGLSTIAGGYTTITAAGFSGTLSGNANLTGAAGTYTLTNNSAPTTIRSLVAGNTVALGGKTLATGGILSNANLTISGAGSLMAASAGGELVFDQTAGTVTVNSTIADNGAASSLTKTGAGTLMLASLGITGAINVTGGTLFVNNGSTGSNTVLNSVSSINVTNGTLKISDDIGAGNVTKTLTLNGLTLGGNATLTDSGTESNDSGFSVAQQVAIMGANNQVIANGFGTLQAAFGFYGGITGSGSLAASGNGNRPFVLIQGDNSGFTGILTAGTFSATGGLSIQTTNGSGWGVGSTLIVAGGPVYVNNNTNLTVGSGTRIVLQAITSADINQATSKLVINSGAFTTAANITIGSLNGTGGSYNLTGVTAKTLTVGALDTTDAYAGNITGAALNFTKTGTDTMTLSGVNSYGGKTTVGSGMLQFAKTQALYNSATGSWTAAKITVANGTTLALNVGGTGEFAASDVSTLLANISVASSATTGLQAGARIGFDTTNAAGGTFTQSSAITNSTGANGGAIGITKLGTGTLVLSKVNTYTGDTAVKGGTLVVSGSGSLGAGSYAGNISLAGGSAPAFNYASSADQILSGQISGGGSLIKSVGTGTLTLSGNDTYTGATDIQAGTLKLTGSLTSNITAENTATLSGNGSTTGSVTLLDGSTIVAGLSTGSGNAASNAIRAAGTLTVGSGPPATVNIIATQGSGHGVCVEDVVQYTGTNPNVGSDVNATGSPFNVAEYRLVDAVTPKLQIQNADGAGGVVKKVVLTYLSATDAWNAGNGNWDATATNWQNAGGVNGAGPNDRKYASQDAVLFTDNNDSSAAHTGWSGTPTNTGGTGPTGNPSAITVNLNATVIPSHVTVWASNTNYTFSGAGGIGGNSDFTQAGASTTTFASTIANTYTGATTVSAGTLVVNGTHTANAATDAYTISNAATLAGSGTINIGNGAGQTVSIASTAFVTAGSDANIGTIGTLTLIANKVSLAGTYQCDLNLDATASLSTADGTLADAINVTGDIDLTGMTLNLRGSDAVLPAAGTPYAIKLLSWTGSDNGTAVADGAKVTNYTGLTLRADQSIVRLGNAYYLVPEPASFALLGLGSLLLLRRPTRRRGRGQVA